MVSFAPIKYRAELYLKYDVPKMNLNSQCNYVCLHSLVENNLSFHSVIFCGKASSLEVSPLV